MDALLVRDITNEDYHAHEAFSRSQLADLLKSPRHFWYNHIREGAVAEQKKAMTFGSAFHIATLEPETYSKRVALLPEDQKRPTKAQINAANPSDSTVKQIEFWERWDKENAGKEAIKVEESESIQEMSKALREEKAFAEIAGQKGVYEAAIFWTDERTGIKLKAKLDFLSTDFKTIWDLKSTASAAPQDFEKSIVNYLYDVQAHMCMEAIRNLGSEPEQFIFACVEKKPPYCPAVYKADDWVLLSGKKRFEKLMDKLAYCLETGDWHGYNKGSVEDISVPSWHAYKIEEEMSEIKIGESK